MDNIIRIGYYKPNDNETGEIENLIHVLGENDEKPNYFDIKGKKEPLHESIILDKYTFFPSALNGKREIKKPKKFNIGDLSKLNTTSIINEEKTNEKIIDVSDVDFNDKKNITTNKHPKFQIKSEDEINREFFITKIKNKTKIEKRKQSITFINCEYDIIEIQKLCDLFDYDANVIIKELVSFETAIIHNFDMSEPIVTQKDVIVTQAEPIVTQDLELNKIMDDISNIRKSIDNHE